MSDHDESGISSGMVQVLIDHARSATRHAYVPYSSFPVGAAILVEDGSIISGVNIENASFGLTVCGERVAVFNAAAMGYREIRAVAISAPKSAFTSPCGACRQVLNEFKPSRGELIVILDGGITSEPRLMTLSGLLPLAFGPHDLG